MTGKDQPGPPRSTLYVIGLGPGPADLLTLQSWELLASGKPLRIRQPRHEAAQTLLSRGFRFEPITEEDPVLLARGLIVWAVASKTAVYALPGHPLEAPETRVLLEQGAAAGVKVEIVPSLSDLDRLPGTDPLTGTIAGVEAVRAGRSFARLVALLARLRSPEGCPWDREQTHSSLAIHLLEETHEVLDAIDRADMADLEEELGDVLLQVVFHTQLAREAGDFEISEVIEELIAKLVYRHPHIFGDAEVSGAADVVANWEALKRGLKVGSSPADDIPKDLPALLYAHKAHRRLAGAGIPGAGIAEVAGRVAALARSVAERDGGEAEQIIGELLFEVVGLAQQVGVDPEGALRRRARARLESIDGSELG